MNKNERLPENNGHISLKKAACFDQWAQVFAVFVPDEYRGAAAVGYFDRAYDYFRREFEDNVSSIEQCRSSDELGSCAANGKAAAILSVEGGAVLAGDIARLDSLFERGVRLITLTWNGDNEIARGCQSGSEGGLTAFGRDVLRRMNELHMAVDVSHLSREGFWDVAKRSDAPFVASHSTCCAVLQKTRADSADKARAVNRNLDDEQIRQIISRGGLIGVNFCRSFLGDPGDDGFEAVRRHLEHILNLGGENAAAIGSDYDGCNVNPELDGIDKISALAAYLMEKGWPQSLLDKIFFYNAKRFFQVINNSL
ncbi:MAG: membrane dipeptidase [Oscillospiraceae bacterium]|nr:membrane dipeptidase [Oscillospiraceae bacterium]